VIAEDQGMVLGALAALLEIEGDITVVARSRNGKEALQAVLAHKPDVFITDIEMPEMTGLEAAAQIRREEKPGAHVPIVAMTASAMSEDRDRCLAAGMDDFISKPVSYKAIEQMITATFSHRE